MKSIVLGIGGITANVVMLDLAGIFLQDVPNR